MTRIPESVRAMRLTYLREHEASRRPVETAATAYFGER
jgi:hypothetical protein